MKRYKVLARCVSAMLSCSATGNTVWRKKWHDKIEEIMQSSPYGARFDSETTIDLEANNGILVFNTSFQHMNNDGYHDGWTNHKITVKPSLEYDFKLTITGQDRDNIKDYISDVFSIWLEEEIEEY